MNARRCPGWILSNHTEDQGANLFADTLPSSYLADSGDPRPIQPKSRSMPVHDGSRSDQDERLPPPGPAHSQRNPERLVQGSQSTARSLRVQSQQLPTERQVSKTRSFREQMALTIQSRRLRSDAIIARILTGQSESDSRQVIHFAGVRRFGETQAVLTPRDADPNLTRENAGRMFLRTDLVEIEFSSLNRVC